MEDTHGGATPSVEARITGELEQLEIAELICAVHRAGDVETTTRAIAEAAVRVTRASRAIVLLANDASTQLVPSASFGTSPVLGAVTAVQLDPALARWLSDSVQAVVHVHDPFDQCLRPLVEMRSIDSCALAVAAIHDNTALLGVLLLEFADSLAASAGQNQALALLVAQAGVSLRKLPPLDDLRRRVEYLSALVALDEALAHAPDFEEVLSQIIDRVKQLVDAELGGLMLYDPESNELVMQKPALGASEELIKQAKLPITGPGVTVHCFRTGKPYLSNDMASDPFHHPLFQQTLKTRNSITVPLEVNGRRIGVFHVVNKRLGDFTENDLRLVVLLATHLGILIHNARLIESNRLLLESERESVARLRQLNDVIDRQREGLARTLAIHDKLTRMVLDGQGLAAITANLGRLLANHVAVIDRFGNLVAAYSPSELVDSDKWGRTIAEGWLTRWEDNDPAVRAARARMEHERRPVSLPPTPTLCLDWSSLIAPVVLGQEILAYVLVLESNRCLDDLDVMAVERTSIAIALQMMREKAAAEARYKLRGDLIAELLSGSVESDEILLSRVAYLGIDLHVSRSVLLVEMDECVSPDWRGRTEDEIVAQKSRLLEVVERVCQRTAPEALVSAKGDAIVVLAKDHAASALVRRKELGRLGDSLRAEVGRWIPAASISVGIGGFCANVSDYARSFQEARQAIDVIRASRQRDRTMAFDETGIYGVLFELQNRDKLLVLARQSIGRLLEYDLRRGSQLAETLDQYFLHDCHLKRTAAALSIHHYTLRYRLRRIEQITGIELRTFEARFNLRLAITVLRTLGPKSDHAPSHSKSVKPSPPLITPR